MSLSKSVSNFPLFEEYRKWVVEHSDILSTLETVCHVTSYLIAGRIKKSPAFSELLYSITNLIVFVNDQILLSACQEKDAGFPPKPYTVLEKSRIFLTTLEYTKVFLEISALKIWGVRGKWIAISVIQIIKAAWRILVLLHSRTGLVCRPISPLNRKTIQQKLSSNGTAAGNHATGGTDGNSAVFLLESGRVIRRVNGAPLAHERNWKLPVQQETSNVKKTKLEGNSLLGEIIHINKPLCHLALMGRCGTGSWIPWLAALGMDVASLKLIDPTRMNLDEKQELKRRQLTLLMYLLRSPFYDRLSRRVLVYALTNFSRLPLIGILVQHLLQYLPYWQQLYSYTWDC